MRLRTGSAWRDSEDGLNNGVLKAISRVTEGLVGKLKEASDHIANRLYREKFSHPLAQGMHQKDDADIYSGDQIKKAGSDHTATSGVKPNPSEKSADEYLRSIYEDRYHMDGSAQAYEYARSLASLPDQLHRIVAAHVKEKPHGGIWLGGGNLHDLGHAEWSATKPRGQKPGGWPDGTTWDDASGVYSEEFRALLVGHTQHTRKDTAVHEFGHALDAALSRPSPIGRISQGPAFSQFHAKVLSHIQKTRPDISEYFARPGEAGRRELFAEGIAWYNKTMQNPPDGTAEPEFYGSVSAGRHLIDFYRALDKELGITR
ncbi:hypothetical protein B0T36_05430 [Nocardia donostiensis]|nr:hypothetical protein B0T36_05430 [Nocardia donostiensis]